MRVLFTLAAVLLVALVPPTARASHLKEQPKKHKIVYHLDEAGLDKARSVLGNIQNHIRGVGGARPTRPPRVSPGARAPGGATPAPSRAATRDGRVSPRPRRARRAGRRRAGRCPSARAAERSPVGRSG